MWVHLRWDISECSCLPMWLEELFPNVGCLAFMSARRYTGWGLLKSV